MIVRKNHRVVVLGITGKQGTFWTEKMIAYGTNVVAGINPKRAGESHIGVPIFATTAEAAAKAGPPSVALLNAMAQAYEQKGENAKAAEALRRSLSQRPDQKGRAADLRRLQAKITKGCSAGAAGPAPSSPRHR